MRAIILWVSWRKRGLASRVRFGPLSISVSHPAGPASLSTPALPCFTISMNQLIATTASCSAASPAEQVLPQPAAPAVFPGCSSGYHCLHPAATTPATISTRSDQPLPATCTQPFKRATQGSLQLAANTATLKATPNCR